MDPIRFAPLTTGHARREGRKHIAAARAAHPQTPNFTRFAATMARFGYFAGAVIVLFLGFPKKAAELGNKVAPTTTHKE